MKTRSGFVLAALCALVGHAQFSMAAGPSADQAIEWVKKLEPVAMATAAEEALAEGRIADAVAAAAGEGDAPAASPGGAPVPAGLGAYPPGFQGAVATLLGAVQNAAAGATDADGAKRGALQIMRAIEAALPALRPLAATSSGGHLAVDASPLREAAETIEEARRSGDPFKFDGAQLKNYEDALSRGEISGQELDAAFHRTIEEPLPHAVHHALHLIEHFLEDVRAHAGGGGHGVRGGGVAPASHLGGCVEPVPGILRICDEDPQLITTPVLLHIDLGGGDTYAYDVAGGSGPGAVQVVVDLEGSDVYFTTSPGGGMPAVGQGAGVGGGIGILVDVLGSDVYVVDGSSAALGQGYGSAGAGVLVDLEGSDAYTLTDVHSVLGDPAPATVSITSPEVEVRGQGAGDAAGIGLQLDGLGSDLYFALAATDATIPIGPFSTRPDGTVVVHTSASGSATAEVQGAASGAGAIVVPLPVAPGIGVNVDAANVDAANPPTVGFNTYFAFSVTVAISNEWSHIAADGSRTCISDSGDALTRAQGAGSEGGIGAHASNAANSHFADAVTFSIADCFETVFTDFNLLMVSDATSGDATTESQGAGLAAGAGGFAEVGGASTNVAFADSFAVACSNCFQLAGTCTADTLTGEANTYG
ncbi:MAG: hypothetical protein ACREQ9_26970, partial [Candidatus Binatia bacterium]